MSTEPPPPVNPYSPSEALAHDDEAPRRAQARSFQRRLHRAVAIIVAVLTYPLGGTGLYVLGRRKAVVWMIATSCCLAIVIASVFANAPAVFFAAAALELVIALVALVYTLFAKPGAAPAQGIKAVLVVVALTLAARGGSLAMKKWLVEAYHIPSGGMVPTLDVGDHILVAKTKRIVPGDVVVFRYPLDRKVSYAKRVVAVGGQTVEIDEGVVAVDGVALEQELVGNCPSPKNDLPTRMPIDVSACRLLRENAGKGWYSIMRDPSWSPPGRRYRVPPGHLFVLGDNRDNSSDSRVWGPVSLDLVEGRAAFIWWSRDQRGTIHWDRIGKKID